MIPVVDMKRTGERIRELREKKGYSVTDLAECMGLGALSVYKWQEGKNLPTIDNLVALGYIVGVGIDEIIVIREV